MTRQTELTKALSKKELMKIIEKIDLEKTKPNCKKTCHQKEEESKDLV